MSGLKKNNSSKEAEQAAVLSLEISDKDSSYSEISQGMVPRGCSISRSQAAGQAPARAGSPLRASDWRMKCPNERDTACGLPVKRHRDAKRHVRGSGQSHQAHPDQQPPLRPRCSGTAHPPRLAGTALPRALLTSSDWVLVAFPFKTPLAWGVLVPPASRGADGKRDRARNQERSMASSTYSTYREGMTDLWRSAGGAGLSEISRALRYVEAMCTGGQRAAQCPTIKGPATNNPKPTHT